MEALLLDGRDVQHILVVIEPRVGHQQTDPCRWGIRDILDCQQVLEPEAENGEGTMTGGMKVVGHTETMGGDSLAPSIKQLWSLAISLRHSKDTLRVGRLHVSM